MRERSNERCTMCGSVFILVSLCLTSLVLGENIYGHKEKECTLLDYSRGICKPSSECLGESTDSTACSTQGGITYVCCKLTESGAAPHVNDRRAESPPAGERNGESKSKNDTNYEKIGERFFFDDPIARVVVNWDNKGDGRRKHYNYNYNGNQGGWYSFEEGDVYTIDIPDSFDFGENKREEKIKYPWGTYRPTTQRPYNSGYDFYEKEKDERYPWETNIPTTRRPYNPGYNNYEEKEDQKYPWNSNRPTTRRPYNPGYNNYEEKEDQKYPWNSNRPTTRRPYNPGYNNYEEKEDQKYPWNSNRPTTQRPYNPGYNNYEEKEDQKYPWNSNRPTTRRPYNPGYDVYEKEKDQKQPWDSTRKTTQRPTATRRTTESPNRKQTPVTDSSSHHIGNPNRKRISEIKCEQYSELVTQTITGLPLVPNPSPIEIKVDECNKFQVLIVGGKNASVGEFPHMVAVGYPDSSGRSIKWFCGGSLISEQYVLTAAHCAVTKYGKPVKVRLGEFNLNKDEDGAYPEDYYIGEVIVHPEYRRSQKYNDIALLKLSRRVKLRKDIRPACLHTESTVRRSAATAIGWGHLERAGNQSDVLQKVSLNIVDRRTCHNSYDNVAYKVFLPHGIVDSQLCAGELAGNKDTCQGDSGGPLEILSENNLCVHYVIGITSFGKACGAANSPGVYTRVSSYVPWIENIVWPQ